MAVNDQTAIVANVRQEGLAYPAKVVIVLLIELLDGIYASVDEEAPAVIMLVDKGIKPVDVMRWEVGH